MEVTNQSPVWLDKSHPNFIRWERARNISFERGRFVKQIIEQFFRLKNQRILDLGSGEGGTSKIFSKENSVVSLDISLIRLKRQKENFFINKTIQANVLQLPFSDSSFDIVILQDVIEHVDNPECLISEIDRVLSPNGIVYLSTPNRFSVINFLSDPHWGVPLISVLSRKTITNFFIRFYRRHEKQRKDIPQLLTLTKINKLFSDNYELHLMTSFAVNELFKGNKGIVWSDFHISLIDKIKKLKAHLLIGRISNNKKGFVNNFLTPTFYIVMKRKKQQFEFKTT